MHAYGTAGVQFRPILAHLLSRLRTAPRASRRTSRTYDCPALVQEPQPEPQPEPEPEVEEEEEQEPELEHAHAQEQEPEPELELEQEHAQEQDGAGW